MGTSTKTAGRGAVDVLKGKRIAVVYGAVSEEDGLYIRNVPRDQWSLTHIMETLWELGLSAEHIDPTSPDFAEKVRLFDVAFLNVHGPFGEDGRIQGLLDYLAVPYTGSGVLAGSIGMDKLASKAVFAYLGIAVPRGIPILGSAGAQVPSDFPFPAMLKAVDGGSSVGMALVREEAGLSEEIRKLRDRGFERLFLEEYIDGRSMTVSVIGREPGPIALPSLEFVTESDYYDESTKLGGAGAPSVEYRVPEDLPAHVNQAMSDGAKRVFEFLACSGAIRVDYMVDTVGTPYALEVNTIPGLQQHSNLPVSCSHAGISYSDLLVELLTEALASAKPMPWGVTS